MRVRRLMPFAELLAVCGLALAFAQGAWQSWRYDPPGAAANYTALLGAGLMAFLRRDRLRGAPAPGRLALTLPVLCAAGAMFVVGERLDLLALAGLGLLGIVAAMLHHHRGLRGVVAMRLPLLFLLLAIPVPGRFVAPITAMLLDWTLAIAAAVVGWFGVESEVSGYTLTMPAGNVTLVRDCSGLEGLLLFAPLTLLLLEAHRPLGGARYAFCFLLAAPLAFAANLVRVLVETILVGTTGREIGGDASHDVLGAAALVAAALTLWWLARRGHRAHARAQRRAPGTHLEGAA